MNKTERSDETWEPVTVCTDYFAAEDVQRFRGDRKFSGVQFHPERLEQPLLWREPRMVFVNSMFDLFHEAVPDDQLDQIFAVMALTPQHTYQVLTKRPERMRDYSAGRAGDRVTALMLKMDKPSGCYTHPPTWPLPNVWLGVSCENQRTADERIPLLLQTPAAVRFLSCEPLLEHIDLRLMDTCPHCDVYQQGCPDCHDTGLIPNNAESIDWVRIGGECGPNARPCDVNSIKSIVDQCRDARIPAFVKQLGGNAVNLPVHCGRNGRSKGNMRHPGEWPEYLRVREMPKVAESIQEES